MKVRYQAGRNLERINSQRISRTTPLLVVALLTFFCAGCSSTPKSAPVPTGPPMSPAQASTAREQYINDDSRLTAQQKQAAIERLNGSSGH
jgi:photosystem II stability/assembly factor-like uncharacterized protein